MQKLAPLLVLKNYLVAESYQNLCCWIVVIVSEFFTWLAISGTISILTALVFVAFFLLITRPVFVWFKGDWHSTDDFLSICFYGKKGKKVTISMGWIKFWFFLSFLSLFAIALVMGAACLSELGVSSLPNFPSSFDINCFFAWASALAISFAVIGAGPIALSEDISLWDALTKKSEFREFRFAEPLKRTGKLSYLPNLSRKVVALVQFGRNRRAPARRGRSIAKKCGGKKSSDPDGDCSQPHQSLNQANQSQCCLVKYIGGR